MRFLKNISMLSKPELEQIIGECGFSDTEIKIINMIRNDKSRIEIASNLCITVATLDRRLVKIKTKIENCNKVNIPIWEKMNLTIEEAAEYSNIGINKISEMSKLPDCPFVLYIGRKKLIKRVQFEKYINQALEL